MPEHAELSGTCQSVTGAGRGHTEQAHPDRNGLQHIGDSKTAIKDAQRQRTDLACAAPLHRGELGAVAHQNVDGLLRVGARCEPEGDIRGAALASQTRPVVGR